MILKKLSKNEVTLFLFTFILTIAYSIYTSHAWEDWYITYRASKNLAIGNGLVFQIGERLHTFTSPLGVLLPALLNFVTLNSSDDLVLWLFRIVSGLFLSYTVVLLYRISKEIFRTSLSSFILVGVFIFEVKNIDFSINGMETAFLLFSIVALIYTIIFKKSVLLLGAVLSFLQYSRPDGFIYSGAFMVGVLIFCPETLFARNRKDYLINFLKAGVISILIYAPWLVFSTYYYSTPIPHTIIAKGLNRDLLQLIKLGFLNPISFPVNRNIVIDSIFTPPYATSFGGWFNFVFYISWLMTIIGLSALFFRISKFVKAVSLSALVGILYLGYIASFPFPWYVPITTTLVLISFVGVIDRFLDLLKPQIIIIKAFSCVIIGYFLVIFVCSSYQMRCQQEIIENGNRKQIGFWLKQNGKPTDTVFLECLGYIGFYSEMKMYDYPGMSSSEVVGARRVLGPSKDNFAHTIDKLRPKWLVLRDIEISYIKQKLPIIEDNYDLVKVFDVSHKINKIQFLPGRGYLVVDQKFSIFKLK